nr:uncharacterized protein LOC105859761 [Microcebus murinus]
MSERGVDLLCGHMKTSVFLLGEERASRPTAPLIGGFSSSLHSGLAKSRRNAACMSVCVRVRVQNTRDTRAPGGDGRPPPNLRPSFLLPARPCPGPCFLQARPPWLSDGPGAAVAASRFPVSKGSHADSPAPPLQRAVCQTDFPVTGGAGAQGRAHGRCPAAVRRTPLHTEPGRGRRTPGATSSSKASRHLSPGLCQEEMPAGSLSSVSCVRGTGEPPRSPARAPRSAVSRESSAQESPVGR